MIVLCGSVGERKKKEEEMGEEKEDDVLSIIVHCNVYNVYNVM